MAEVCLSCAQGYYWECTRNPPCLSQSNRTDAHDTPVDGKRSTPSTGDRDGMKWAKADEDIKDLKSTGRKRAAVLYPLDRDASCEWRGLAFAGGGLMPIPGCVAGTQSHRHHGPILLTTANVEGNVHRICTSCHNRWHHLNDPFVLDYMGTVLWRPHDENTQLEPEEIARIVAVGHTEYARRRVAPRTYDKSQHDYRDYLERLRERGVSIVNDYLGV